MTVAGLRWRLVRGPLVGVACGVLGQPSAWRGLVATVCLIVAFQISEGK